MLTWVVRFNHWWAPITSNETVLDIAEIVHRECFSACSRLAYDRRGTFGRPGRTGGHREKSPGIMREYLLDPQNESVQLDNGRSGPLTATMRFATGAVKREGIPYYSFVVVPWTDDEPARDEAACDLARVLRASIGAMSVWSNYNHAERFAFSQGLMEERARELGLSERRHKEWRLLARDQVQVDTEISGPEWGLFLSAGHLAKVPLATLRASGAFAEVRELEGTRAFLRLTDDPHDALAPGYEARLDRARDALRPILADLSRLD